MVRRRGQPIGRGVAEGRPCALLHARRREDPAARRTDVGPGRAGRVRPVRTPALTHARAHRGLHLAPLLDRATGGPHHLPRARASRGGGHPPGADAPPPALPPPFPDPAPPSPPPSPNSLTDT